MPLTRAALVALAAAAGLLGCSATAPPTADQTDNDHFLLVLTDVAAQRVLLADTVAAAKWGTAAPIDDPVREQVVLDAAATKATQLGVDPVFARVVFTDQIEANKAVQNGLYSQWRAHPDRAPITRPNLDQVRPILDRITDQLLAELKVTAQIRTEPSCTGQLTATRHRVERTRHLDPLHEDALIRALSSLCRQAGAW
jgi:chorismate mutase